MMFQLRSQLVIIINSVIIELLSILDQVSVISFQKLKATLLNPADFKLLLTKLEDQLMSHQHLALPQLEGDNIWNIYKFMNFNPLCCQILSTLSCISL